MIKYDTNERGKNCMNQTNSRKILHSSYLISRSCETENPSKRNKDVMLKKYQGKSDEF